MQKYQRNYTVSEKECLGVVKIIDKFRHYLLGRDFVVKTDHHALCPLPNARFKSSRLNRWANELAEFSYFVEYVKGENHPADCFSRAPDEWDHHVKETEDKNCRISVKVDPVELESKKFMLTLAT